MANGTSLTKDDMAGMIDDVTEVLQGAYTPESSREDLAAAVGDALDILSGDSGDDDDGPGADDDDDNTGDEDA